MNLTDFKTGSPPAAVALSVCNWSAVTSALFLRVSYLHTHWATTAGGSLLTFAAFVTPERRQAGLS
jgi:hypothetical protein